MHSEASYGFIEAMTTRISEVYLRGREIKDYSFDEMITIINEIYSPFEDKWEVEKVHEDRTRFKCKKCLWKSKSKALCTLDRGIFTRVAMKVFGIATVEMITTINLGSNECFFSVGKRD